MDDGISRGKKLWRKEDVKTLRRGQLLAYSGQDIQVLSMEDNFYNSKIVLANMTIDIVCQDIKVSKVLISEQHFFWDIV